jgi:hypothetical protein
MLPNLMNADLAFPILTLWTLCTTLEDTDYADDLALLSHTEDHMQEKTRKLGENARMIGLKINAKKTKFLSYS